LSHILSVLTLSAIVASAGEWHSLAPLPDKEGFAGSFAGVSHGALLVAGGANFPGRKPWEGGEKIWHELVYALEGPRGSWKVIGRLPRPLGYGVSVSHGGGVVCVGGGGAVENSAEAFRLVWRGGELTTTRLPPLPRPVANACGALVGDRLYVAGGQERPDARAALRRAWWIDLSAAERDWTEVEPWPGPARMLAVAAGCDGAFWVAGGVDLVAGGDGQAVRTYLRDAYRYDPGRGWTRVADLPCPVAAAPSPAPGDGKGFYILGGDDGAQIGVAPGQHRGFRTGILRYDLATETWQPAGMLPAPRVTVPCVRWGTSWVVPGGEVRPGVRSPEVRSFRPGNEE
jgi:N-acetylneuraminate epimerase